MIFTQAEALCALRALYRTAPYHNEATAAAGRYVKMTGIVPDWLIEMTARTEKWFVRHGGETYETTATSRGEAVNNVRWKLYGRKPEAECGDFDAVNPAFVVLDAIGGRRREENRTAPRDLFGGKISKTDALLRMRRLVA